MTTPSNPTADGTAARQLTQQINSLASALNTTDSGYATSSSRKAVVTAVDYTTTPPTATINISGDTTDIPGILMTDSVAPMVGDTVNVLVQGPSYLIVSRTATDGGWLTPGLQTGFTTNGDSQGNLQYRMIRDNGSLKMQWQGAVAVSGASTLVVSGLATTYHPSSQRKLIVPRGMGNGNAVLDIQVVFSTGGAVTIAGGTYTFPAHVHTLGNSGNENEFHHHPVYVGATGADTFTYADNDYVPSTGAAGHTHSLGNSTGTTGSTALPDWVSFNGVEYFL